MLAWVILADQVDSRRHNDEVPHLLTALTSPGLLVSPTGYTVGTPPVSYTHLTLPTTPYV